MAKSVNGNLNGNGQADQDCDNDATTPICRCRVLYLGSAVPHITKDGLQGIQEPLRDLYPEQGVFWNTDRDHNATGIDSWLSVWSNGILVENVDDKGNTIRRFHPIESLHYCAAVRYVSVPAGAGVGGDPTKNGSTTANDPHHQKVAKFLPLDSPFSKSTIIDAMKQSHPPLFACILRRTSGIKVLECHAFICKKEAAANALVRCCFHAYADTMHAKQIELESPYEQLDKRRSRSIGSALDSQSLIEDKVNTWQKNSTGGSSGSGGGGTPDDPAGGNNGFASDTRSISRQVVNKQQRTPSMVSLISHSMAEPPPPMGHHHPHHHMEPIYYNNNNSAIPPTGTLRSVRSFISLAALKSHNSKKSRSRQMPIPLAGPLTGTMPPMPLPPPHGPPPVMFATLTKKELKKVLKKESTLKRKHKYKDFPLPFMAPNGYPFMYGPPMPGPPPAPPGIHHGAHHPMHPIYAPMPPPMAPPPPPHAMALPPNQFYGTIDSRKGRCPLPPPTMPPPSGIGIENGHHNAHFDEPIYMPAVPSPNGTLRPITPHMDPIYLDGRGQPTPMPMIGGPGPQGGGPPQMYMPNPQMPGNLMPCTFVSTLSRKELKELEKQKAAMKKAAKKEKKKSSKKGVAGMPMANGQPPPLGLANPQQHQQMMMEEPPMDFYQPRPPYGYPPDDMVHVDPDESMMSPSEIQLSSGNYSNASTAGGVGGGGGIYKKKGHLNERAFSYSIRQEHRSRSNSLSNLAFENGMPPPPPPTTANSGQNGSSRNGENGSHNNSSISLKSSSEAAANQQNNNNNKSMMMMNGGGPQQQQYEHANGNGGGRMMMMMTNGHHGHHPHHHGGVEGPIDPNQLASRMSNLSLKNGYGPNNPPPPPPPLPPNGYHYHQRTATIKRL